MSSCSRGHRDTNTASFEALRGQCYQFVNELDNNRPFSLPRRDLLDKVTRFLDSGPSFEQQTELLVFVDELKDKGHDPIELAKYMNARRNQSAGVEEPASVEESPSLEEEVELSPSKSGRPSKFEERFKRMKEKGSTVVSSARSSFNWSRKKEDSDKTASER